MTLVVDTLPKTLRQARIASGLRQADLSRLTGVPQSQISRIEANSVDPRTSTLLQLAHGVGLDVVLVPLRCLPAAHSIIRKTRAPSSFDMDNEPQPAYQLSDEDEDE